MRRIKLKLVIAYDGSRYAGWQVQKTGLGVQEEIEKALRRIFPSAGGVHGSSRTDTGVHAVGMVAHVEVARAELRMPVSKVVLALNAHLPEDIRVQKASHCADDFHARFHAGGKEYRYRIWNAPAMNPLWRFYAWHVPRKLDLGAMRAAADGFVGTHDFKSFAGTLPYGKRTTVRTLTRCVVQHNGPLLTVILRGNGFLYRMCRGIVGTIVQAGLGKFEPGAIRSMLAAKDRRAGGMTAPARGLVLWKVFYPTRTQRGAAATELVSED